MTLRESVRRFKSQSMRSVKCRCVEKGSWAQHTYKGLYECEVRAIDCLGFERTFTASHTTRCKAKTSAIDKAFYEIQYHKNSLFRLYYLSRNCINCFGDGI